MQLSEFDFIVLKKVPTILKRLKTLRYLYSFHESPMAQSLENINGTCSAYI